MKISTTDFEGDPNLGLYGFATDKYAFLGMKKSLPVLKTKIIVQPMGQTRFSGIFATGNSHGIIISSFFKEYDEYIDIPVLVLKTDFTAIGNLVLINDNGIIISPLIKNHAKEISDFFGLECKATTIAETGVVGSCAIATNKGCVINPFVKKPDLEVLDVAFCSAWQAPRGSDACSVCSDDSMPDSVEMPLAGLQSRAASLKHDVSVSQSIAFAYKL